MADLYKRMIGKMANAMSRGIDYDLTHSPYKEGYHYTLSGRPDKRYKNYPEVVKHLQEYNRKRSEYLTIREDK